MTEIEIRALLKAKGATVAAIAEAAGVSEATVRKVIKGEAKSRHVANGIALFLGKKPDDLWPGAYPAQYSRRTPEKVRRELRAAMMNANSERAA